MRMNLNLGICVCKYYLLNVVMVVEFNCVLGDLQILLYQLHNTLMEFSYKKCPTGLFHARKQTSLKINKTYNLKNS